MLRLVWGDGFKPKANKSSPMRGHAFHTQNTSPYAEYAGMRLHSAFQPIVSVVHSKIVGHEALVRGLTSLEEPLAPADLFPRLLQTLRPEEVHEICARLHLTTFSRLNHDGWLFLNVNPDTALDRQHVRETFGSWLVEANLTPSQVVIEIIETRACDGRMLSESVQGFRDLGCLVAIDDFGAGESNFERVWRLRPDIVKLDRAMIAEAATNPLIHRILPGLVTLVHEAGCLVVMEGIETEHQAMIAVESDVDFVQGYYFSRPDTLTGDSSAITKMFDELAETIKINEAERSANTRTYISSFVERFRSCVDQIMTGSDFDRGCSSFIALEGIQRVYQLDSEGYQIGHNLESTLRMGDKERFNPCADGRGANWYRRPYFQRAVSAKGRVQVSRPYLSITDAQSCVTLSIAFEVGGETRVLCADIDHQTTDTNRESGARFSTIVRR